MQKITRKSIFSNLLKLVFITLFVGVFSQIFGTNNSLTWVCVLIGTMMYWYMDIGINIKQAPFVIVLMFLQIGFSNKLAQINPVIGLIVNFITIFLIMYIPSAKPEYKAYMPFILCYIFNQSNPAEGHDFVTRMLSLLIGGVIVSLVYYFKNKNSNKEHDTIKQAFKSMSITSNRFIIALKMAIGVSIAMLIGTLFGVKKTMWISMSVMSLTQIDFSNTQKRFISRIISTIIGSIVFAILFQALVPEKYDVIVTIILNYIYTFINDYKYQVIFITINAISSASAIFDTSTAIELKNILTDDFASELFDLSEDSIYNILEEFNENQNIDKTLTYVFIKAVYIHIAKVILDKENISLNFDEVYSKYRMYLSIYYKSNNSQISQELLNEILDAFDKSFAIIESLEFNRIEDSYEFRHHIIDSFELLRKILEKKSKCNIRTDIFDKYIADIQEQSEKINNYIIGLK